MPVETALRNMSKFDQYLIKTTHKYGQTAWIKYLEKPSGLNYKNTYNQHYI